MNGAAHDKITYWVAGGTFATGIIVADAVGVNPVITAIAAAGGCLFSGLMCGPDLDTWSVETKRWGCLHILWHPYRRWLIPRHRHPLSHGPIIGTALRVCYLGVLVTLLGIILTLLGVDIFTPITQLFQVHLIELGILVFGMEVGAMAHTIADLLDSSVLHTQASKKK